MQPAQDSGFHLSLAEGGLGFCTGDWCLLLTPTCHSVLRLAGGPGSGVRLAATVAQAGALSLPLSPAPLLSPLSQALPYLSQITRPSSSCALVGSTDW